MHQPLRHSDICQSRNTLPPFLTIRENISLRTLRWYPQCIFEQSCISSIQLFLVYNEIAPYSTAGTHCHGSEPLTSWENLACRSHHCFRTHHSRTPHSAAAAASVTMRSLLTESMKLVAITHFYEFLTASGREGDTQLHLEMAKLLKVPQKRA